MLLLYSLFILSKNNLKLYFDTMSTLPQYAKAVSGFPSGTGRL